MVGFLVVVGDTHANDAVGVVVPQAGNGNVSLISCEDVTIVQWWCFVFGMLVGLHALSDGFDFPWSGCATVDVRFVAHGTGFESLGTKVS